MFAGLVPLWLKKMNHQGTKPAFHKWVPAKSAGQYPVAAGD
jgi:hypothetical protein